MRRLLAWLALAVVAASCGSGGFFRQYEYEEEIYLSLNGTATVYVNASVAALNALRGTSLDTSPTAQLDCEQVRRFYTTPVTHDVRVTTSRRNNRRFIHVRAAVDDVRRLGEAAPFAWSTYELKQERDLFVYRQSLGAPTSRTVSNAGWTGREVVAVRLHLPSKIEYHNALAGNLKRGNILVWEQTLTERLRGEPIAIDARMETQSILYRTLWLFAATFAVVAVVFVAVIWWMFRRGVGTARPGTYTENQVMP